MKEFLRACKEISVVSFALINIGMKLVLGMLLVGIFVYYYNENFVGDYHVCAISLQIIQKAWSLFVLFILGGLAFDCYEKSK